MANEAKIERAFTLMPKGKRKPSEAQKVEFEADVFTQALSNRAASLLLSIQSWRAEAQSRDTVGLLYHYTNAAGLLGIVEQNKIWATHTVLICLSIRSTAGRGRLNRSPASLRVRLARLQSEQSHGPEAVRDLARWKINGCKKRSTGGSTRRKICADMAGVFISYRRTDAGGWAGRLRDHLALRFGSNVIWQDVEDLNVGKDYLSQILKQIKSSDAVLIVIGPHWLKEGLKRLRDPKDVLRMEIQHALKNKRAAVIPTLVGGTPMPDRKELPPAISGLVDRHGVALSDVDWARSMQFLFERLQDIVRGRGTTEPLEDLHSTLLTMQEQYFGLIAHPQRALEVASRALSLLDRQMPSHPHDHYLQMFRGYFLKNRAMSLRDLGDIEAFENSLQEADRAFQTIRSEAELYLSNAYNGLGSVTMLKSASRRSLRQALRWIDKSLELVPDHRYAKHDREEALRFLKTAKG